MALFKFGVPVESEMPDMSFDIDPLSPLPAGTHRIQLVVVDDSRNESLPSILTFQVIDRVKPNAVITGPTQVEFNQPFRLGGEKSFDVGGKVVLYRWTLLD